jgi:hypothetical protein
MKVRIEEKVLATKFWNGNNLIGGCKYDWHDNKMLCQIVGKGCIIDFSFLCMNDGKDMQNAISKTKMRLQKEYDEITFEN